MNTHKLYEKYKEHGITDLTYQCFDGYRHSLLFEKNRTRVYEALLKWLNERTYI